MTVRPREKDTAVSMCTKYGLFFSNFIFWVSNHGDRKTPLYGPALVNPPLICHLYIATICSSEYHNTQGKSVIVILSFNDLDFSFICFRIILKLVKINLV